jgi:nucleoside-diphosphate-sugar epimerase
MAKILVTGGAGFIGSNLTEALLKKGHEVRVLDNFSTGKKENLNFDEKYSALQIIEGDIARSQVCQSAMRGVDYVFHQAALPSVQQSVEDPLTSNRINVEGTLNVLLAAKEAGVKRVIYASSCAIYGDDPALPKQEEMASHPLSPYALQKYIGERYGGLFSQLYHLETVSLRYFNVFGPRQDPGSVYSAVIPRFIEAFLQRNSPVVFGDGEQSRDFVYVEDVVQANLLAMSRGPLWGDVINVASGRSISLNQLLAFLGEILNLKIPILYQESREGDIRHSLGDIQKAKQVLNYEPHIEIKAGLERTVHYWVREKGKTGNEKKG